MNANAYTNDVNSLIEMFLDASAGESANQNRLITTTLDSGETALVGYGEKILATYDETENLVTVNLGHKSGGGHTVSRWLNSVAEKAASRRDVRFSDNAPWFAPPNAESAQYIDSYKSFRGTDSAVERKASAEVVESLRWLNQYLI